jgi:Putative zinc- or iron-chelating domain
VGDLQRSNRVVFHTRDGDVAEAGELIGLLTAWIVDAAAGRRFGGDAAVSSPSGLAALLARVRHVAGVRVYQSPNQHEWDRRRGFRIAWWHDVAESRIQVTGKTSEDAGRFSVWLDTILQVLREGQGSDVPCGSCTACCTSSQFIHISPDEVDALAVIPANLLFPAPRLPAGHVLMGYDERGHCPMLIDGACSIYEDRPRTCRTYDCRVFAASGLNLEDPAKSAINDRVGRWQFQFVNAIDGAKLDAV